MNHGAFNFVTKPINFEVLEITIEKTIQHVKQIRETLQSVKENNILRMFVDETVLNFMDSREFESMLLVNETVKGSVAFIDICGFTSISETQAPDRVVKLLNAYFVIMLKEVIHEKGIIDKFIGDAIMDFFKGPYHLDRAIDACLKIRNIPDEQPDLLDDLTFRPHVSIGINSGEMIS